MSGNKLTNGRWKRTVEKFFGQLGILICRHPKLWLSLLSILIIAIASQLTQLRTDTAIENFLDQDSKAIINYNNFKDMFGRDEAFIIFVETDNLFDQTFIDNLRAFHRAFEDETPYIQSIDSLANALHIHGENDTLTIDDLLPHELPTDSEQLQKLKDYTFNNVSFQNYFISKDHPTLLALEKNQTRMGGTMVLEVSIDTGQERDINNPAFLKQVDKTLNKISQWHTETYQISKVMSVIDLIKDSNRALHNNDPNQYVIPDNGNLISQELFLVEMDEPDNLFKLISRDYRNMRITMMTPWVDAIYFNDLTIRLKHQLDNDLALHNTNIVITGISTVLGSTFVEMLSSTAKSYLLAGGVITLMMMLLVGSFKLGITTMIPSLMPITIVIAILQLTGQSLDIFTMLIGSIAIGLTVDDNVHFIHGFRRNLALTGDAKQAIKTH